MIRVVVVLLFVASALITKNAWADPPARVSVDLPSCRDAFDQDALLRLLVVELHADGVGEVVRERGEEVARIRVEAQPCSAQVTELVVTIEDTLTNKLVRRTMSASDVPAPSRPRAFALAIAELLRASWAELSLPDAPAPPPTAPASILGALKLHTPPPPALPSTSIAETLSLFLAIDTRVFVTHGSAVVGPSIGASRSIGSLPLRLRADVWADFGKTYDPLGTIVLALVGGDVSFVAAGGTDAVRAEVGPSLALAYGRASGHAATDGPSAAGSSAIVSLTLASHVSVHLGERVWAIVGVEAGHVLSGLDASAADRVASGFGGPILGASVGVARSF